jgi:hypothetical protein
VREEIRKGDGGKDEGGRGHGKGCVDEIEVLASTN